MATPSVSDLGGRRDWVVRENTTWWDTFTATDLETGAAIDLTSITITAVITSDEESTTALKTFTVTETNAAAGQFRIEVAKASANLPPGSYWYSVQAAGTTSDPWAYGTFTVQDWNQ